MKTGKLFELLKSLSPGELTGLGKAVHSPLLNGSKQVITLYNVLKNNGYFSFDVSKETYERLYKKTFPGEPYNYFKLHRLLGQLRQVAEDYLLYQVQKNNKPKRQKDLLLLYKNRNLKSFFDLAAKQLSKALEASPHRDIEHYEEQLFLNSVMYFNPMKDKYDFKDTTLDNLTDALDRYFALAKMRYGLSIKNRERILRKPGIWRFTEALEKETGFMEDSVLFQLYQQAFLLMNEEEGFSFEAYETLLFENIDKIRNDAKILFVNGLNYATQQLNRGIEGYSKKAFNWYRFGVENGLLIENNKMNEELFGNIIISGCREKEFKWVNEFMESHFSYLDVSIREEVLAYHLGLWHFYQKEFDAVLDVYFNYRFSKAYIPKTRLINVRALFELFLLDNGYFEVLDANIKAYKTYITRDKKFATSKLIPHFNLLKAIEKIAKLIYENKSPKELASAMHKISNNPHKIIGKSWLIERMKEYKKA